MKTTETQVNEDVETLTDDLRRVRNDLANLLRSARHRARNLAAERRSKAQKVAADVRRGSPEAAVSVEEPGPPEREVIVKRSPAAARVLAVAFALSTVVAVLVMRRSRVIGTREPRVGRRWRPRFRREPMVPEKSTTEGLPLR